MIPTLVKRIDRSNDHMSNIVDIPPGKMLFTLSEHFGLLQHYPITLRLNKRRRSSYAMPLERVICLKLQPITEVVRLVALNPAIEVNQVTGWQFAQESLLHEFAHILDFHRRLRIPVMEAGDSIRRYKQQKGVVRIDFHGEAFYTTLREVAAYWFGSPDMYNWRREYVQIQRFYNRDRLEEVKAA